MALVLGVGIDNLRSFVFDHYKADGWATFVAGLSPADGAIASTAVCSGWYDLAVLARLRRALDARFGTGDLRLCEALGRYEAERDLGGITRFFFRFLTPERAVRRIDHYWRRFHQSGSWSAEEVKKGEIVARLSGWAVVDEANCKNLVGYFGRTLEIIGNRSSTVVHRACRAQGHPTCEFVWGWGLRRPSPVPAPIGQGEVLQIAQELMQLTDLDDVSRAIVELCAGQLGCHRVTLWDEPSGAGAPLLRLGQPGRGAGARCIVLTARGEAVGRLEVETNKTTPSAALFDLLAPWFGLALAGRTGPKNIEAERARRLALAKDRIKITHRQAEVLDLVARGRANKEIAADLGIETGTVEIHVTALFKKAGVENRAALAAWFWSF